MSIESMTFVVAQFIAPLIQFLNNSISLSKQAFVVAQFIAPLTLYWICDNLL